MSFLTRLANGLGTLMGVLADTTRQVISDIRTGYDNYKKRGGATGSKAAADVTKRKDTLREVNEEIMQLRNRRMSRGELSAADQRRWNALKEQRDELLTELNRSKEVKAAEIIFDAEKDIEKVDVGVDTTHLLQYNAFADLLGKQCPKCSRPMKLQWKRDLTVVTPANFYWGCTGWYFPKPGQTQAKLCTHTEPLKREDFGLMTDTSAPEFSMTADEFGIILSDPGTGEVIDERLNDLKSDLTKRGKGVEVATCPVHGENMVLKRKKESAGLLDSYFLACPHWGGGGGCTFMEKLKSGSQLAALLKSETGRGIL